ncbi:tyrosine-type recombinase/integrase [Leisingera sp. JC1]|uniref:tyrosine-type recombinase/integrase n=1 Tax=Leisingera sp. JC1 TaxID=1855282 RepID=UPI000807ED24|nr:integrase family protein [Leisingera sp. JC1]OBY25237.1 hypothetical protein A9D60_22510 [Leisingera sp. JC1]
MAVREARNAQPGLTLRVTPTGKKTFSVRVRSLDGIEQRITIGSYPDISLKSAREMAAEKRVEVQKTKGNFNHILRKNQDALKASPTLRELVDEFKAERTGIRVTWTPRRQGGKSEAERRIHSVFNPLLDLRAIEISPDDLAAAMRNYNPPSGKPTANGQCSRARAYLMSVLDWAAGREKFRFSGLKRLPVLNVPDMRDTADPASNDPSITGKRKRALRREEMEKVLPLLVHPAPACLAMRMNPIIDMRPIALRFILLTAARLDEVVTMRWRDVDFQRREWLKPSVKMTKGPPSPQLLPIPDAVIDLLQSLPGYERRRQEPDALVFPSSCNTELQNWDRITKAIQRESKTTNWHRHDLRRTSASLMRLIGVDLGTIDRILGHNIDHDREGTSRALDNYLADLDMGDVEDPQRTALSKLATVYAKLTDSLS